MKKILFNTLPMAMVMLASLTACSSDDMANDGNGKGKPQLDIKLSENDFGSDDDATRYIMADSYVVDSQQVDLGNGYVADVIITKDPAESSDDNTRAFGDGTGEIGNAREGGYTVAAFDMSSTSVKPKFTFTGTCDGAGNFTKTGDWSIDEGNYKFICYKTDGIFSYPSRGTYGVTGNLFSTAEQTKALLSDPQEKEIVSGNNPINFTLKQRTCGIRVKLDFGGKTCSNLGAILSILSGTPAYMYTAPTFEGQLMTSATTNEKTLSFTSNVTPYEYMPPTMPASDFKVMFTGGDLSLSTSSIITSSKLPIDLTNKEFTLDGFTTTEGARYTVNVKINTTLYVTLVEKESTNPISAEAVPTYGDGTITYSNGSGNYSVTPNATVMGKNHDYMMISSGTGKLDWTATPDAHSLFAEVYAINNDPKIHCYNETFTVKPKDNNLKQFKVLFLKKWQENADGSRILRGRFTQDEEIVVATKTDAEGHQYKCIFRTNGTLSYFYITRDDVSQSVTIDGYNFELDQNTGIYTLTIADKSTSDCVNSKAQGHCTAFSYGNTMLSACPVTCNNINVAESYK